MRRWSLLAVVALVGCPVPEPLEDAGTLPDGGACPRELVLGTESASDGGSAPRTFVPVLDGDTVLINQGFQGGWHVWASVHASGLPKGGALTWSLSVDGQVVSSPLRIQATSDAVEPITCGWERRSDTLQFMGVGENYRGATGVLQVKWEAFGVDPVTVNRTVKLQ